MLHYGHNGGDNSIGTGANHRVVLQRVPNYNNVTVNGILASSSWTGYKHWVLAFRVMGELTGTGNIHASGRGYQGGPGGKSNGSVPAMQGESLRGVGASSNSANYGGGGGNTSPQGGG